MGKRKITGRRFDNLMYTEAEHFFNGFDVTPVPLWPVQCGFKNAMTVYAAFYRGLRTTRGSECEIGGGGGNTR